MAGKEVIVGFDKFDLNHVIADINDIRKHNAQRYEMEQLTAIVYVNTEENTCVGYKDVEPDAFWAKGHMPGMPLMPGVIMCEAAAQLASYYTQRGDLLGAKMVGFGGLEEVRFRDPVIPGDRLVLMVRMTRVRRGRMIVCDFQGFVHESLAVSGIIKGIPLPEVPGLEHNTEPSVD